jgi:hypothetical protein
LCEAERKLDEVLTNIAERVIAAALKQRSA